MNRFQKRQTVREVEILGNTYEVDFGRDEILLILQRQQDATIQADAKERGDLSSEDKLKERMKEQKEIYKIAINDILGVPTASGQIFAEDNTSIFHADVFAFLSRKYTEVMTEESPYSPKRLNQ
ncbi:hypothetical protein [Anaerotignum sp. MB30-C6]|uniref:hypothetical protein n=1 Tax=Anaerotignum sp. MB30-C6 TaxID=3070814 RepID=UPI0027DD8864|nr:hypothetical protein [Anaerotignum sp. MB30-C6]WMI81846.1 hypothetical protein RBQ60_03715 [Anaerotignum sp. MB30-C6]